MQPCRKDTVDQCLSSRLQWFVSPEILEEYEEVLRRKRLRIEPKLVKASLRLIEERPKVVRPRGGTSTSARTRMTTSSSIAPRKVMRTTLSPATSGTFPSGSARHEW